MAPQPRPDSARRGGVSRSVTASPPPPGQGGALANQQTEAGFARQCFPAVSGGERMIQFVLGNRREPSDDQLLETLAVLVQD